MPNRFDEDYNNAKELKKEHSFISIKVVPFLFRKNRNLLP